MGHQILKTIYENPQKEDFYLTIVHDQNWSFSEDNWSYLPQVIDELGNKDSVVMIRAFTSLKIEVESSKGKKMIPIKDISGFSLRKET